MGYGTTPVFSGYSTYTRAIFKPLFKIASYNYYSLFFLDILTRREYIYRQFFTSKNLLILPSYFKCSFYNPIFSDLRIIYTFFDSAIYSSEVSREIFYKNTLFMKFLIFKKIFYLSTTIGDLSESLVFFMLDYYLLYFFTCFKNNMQQSSYGSSLLYQSQYRPFHKGVNNMVRLQSTNAISMPIEVRIYVLASSKDVIHSWAIPSAGIKIDCVPGYSSHRILIFLVSGIF